MVVTAVSYPCLFEAFEDVSHDSGGRAGWPQYEVPPQYDHYVDPAERALAGLSLSERSTFATGAEHEREVLVTTPDLQLADALLNAFFESEGGDWRRGNLGEV